MISKCPQSRMRKRFMGWSCTTLNVFAIPESVTCSSNLPQHRLDPVGLRTLSFFNATTFWTTHLLPGNRHHSHPCIKKENMKSVGKHARSSSLTCLTLRKDYSEVISSGSDIVASCIPERYLFELVGKRNLFAAGRHTTRPRTTSPPRKQSPILTLSFSVARTS